MSRTLLFVVSGGRRKDGDGSDALVHWSVTARLRFASGWDISERLPCDRAFLRGGLVDVGFRMVMAGYFWSTVWVTVSRPIPAVPPHFVLRHARFAQQGLYIYIYIYIYIYTYIPAASVPEWREVAELPSERAKFAPPREESPCASPPAIVSRS